MSIQNSFFFQKIDISVQFVQEIKWYKISPSRNQTKIITEAIAEKNSFTFIHLLSCFLMHSVFQKPEKCNINWEFFAKANALVRLLVTTALWFQNLSLMF